MLDRKKNDHINLEHAGSETTELTDIERRLIDLYRRLSRIEQQQVRRVAEILAINPKEKVEG
jgi:molybdenum-dependent DNA-binding transcriptional regulator ModE